MGGYGLTGCATKTARIVRANRRHTCRVPGPAPCRKRQERYSRILAYPLKEWQTPPVGGIRLSVSHPPQFRPSLMNSLFRGRGSEPPGRLEKELASLEGQAATASPGYETQFLNRAG